MSDIQKIKLKRTEKALSNSTLQSSKLDFGEPLTVQSGYLVVGTEDNSNVSACKTVKLQRQGIIDKSVFYTGNESTAQLKNDADPQVNILPLTTAANVSYGNSNLNTVIGNIINGNTVIPNATHAVTADTATNSNNLKTTSANSKCYILGVADLEDPNKQVFHAAPVSGSGVENTGGIYFDTTGVLFGAAWNDFAEFRKCENVIPGTCVVEIGNGKLRKSDSYLLPAAGIISDTFGMIIGEQSKDSLPLAVAGRVLAFVEDRDKLKVGDVLKTAPNGKLAKMKRREIRKYPDRIVGYVSEFPTYEKWNTVPVNGRIWIKIK